MVVVCPPVIALYRIIQLNEMRDEDPKMDEDLEEPEDPEFDALAESVKKLDEKIRTTDERLKKFMHYPQSKHKSS